MWFDVTIFDAESDSNQGLRIRNGLDLPMHFTSYLKDLLLAKVCSIELEGCKIGPTLATINDPEGRLTTSIYYN